MFDRRWQIEVRPGVSRLRIGETVWEAGWPEMQRVAAQLSHEGKWSNKLWDDLRGLFELAGKVVSNDN